MTDALRIVLNVNETNELEKLREENKQLKELVESTIGVLSEYREKYEKLYWYDSNARHAGPGDMKFIQDIRDSYADDVARLEGENLGQYYNGIISGIVGTTRLALEYLTMKKNSCCEDYNKCQESEEDYDEYYEEFKDYYRIPDDPINSVYQTVEEEGCRCIHNEFENENDCVTYHMFFNGWEMKKFESMLSFERVREHARNKFECFTKTGLLYAHYRQI